MKLNLRSVAEYMRQADTEELLDRVTVYREDMEPAAVDLIEGELFRRGVVPDEIVEHERLRRERALIRPDGSVARCSFCDRPAVLRSWGWNRWEGIAPPVFPQRLTYCGVHHLYAGRRPPPFGD